MESKGRCDSRCKPGACRAQRGLPLWHPWTARNPTQGPLHFCLLEKLSRFAFFALRAKTAAEEASMLASPPTESFE